MTEQKLPRELKNWQSFEKISKEEFDRFAKSKSFSVGPLLDSFGDGEYDPYMPNRQAFGILNDGRKIRAWVRGVEGD